MRAGLEFHPMYSGRMGLHRMPIYEYQCRSCHHQFEQLVRTGDTPACPRCQGQDLERLISQITVSSEQTRQQSIAKARRQGEGVRREKQQAEIDEIKHHHDH